MRSSGGLQRWFVSVRPWYLGYAGLLYITAAYTAAGHAAVTVKSSAQFAAALESSLTENIAIAGRVVIDPRHFRTAAVLSKHRSLTLTSAGPSQGILDFGGSADVAFVSARCAWKAQGIHVQGLAAPDSLLGPPRHVALAAMHPSIRGAPDAEFEMTDTSVHFALPPDVQSCPSYTDQVSGSLAPLIADSGSAIARALVIGHQSDSLYVTGPVQTKLPLYSFGNYVGDIRMMLRNVTLQCHDSSPDDVTYANTDWPIDWQQLASWSLNILVLVATATYAVQWLLSKHSTPAPAAGLDAASIPDAVGAEGESQPSSARRTTGLSTSRSTASASDHTVRQSGKVSSSTEGEPSYVDTSWGRATELTGLPAGDSLRSLSMGQNLGSSLGGNTLAHPFGDHHGYLLRMRMEGGLEGIELGPLLGKGSYGRVYKGRWKGALVAIKIVEHTGHGSADVIEGARESLLAASVSHPNIVACYKICTVAITRRAGSCDADGFPISPTSRKNSMGPTSLPDNVDAAVTVTQPAAAQRTSSEAAPGQRQPNGVKAADEPSWNKSDVKVLDDAQPSLADLDASALAHGGYPPRESKSGTYSHTPLRTLQEGDEAKPTESPEGRQPEAAMSARSPFAAQQAIQDGASRPNGHETSLLASPLAGTSADAARFEQPGAASAPMSPGGLNTASVAASNPPDRTSRGSSLDKGTVETWMLLEYADRGSLEQAIAQKRFHRKSLRGRADMLSIFRTLLDVVSGMQYLHGLGMVHGDLKPANCLLKSTVTDSRGFNVKLTDFGLARMVGLNKSHVSTKSFGTIPYMSPELLSSGRMSRANDVFSFGIIMWQIFTGKEPYGGMSPMQVLFNVVDCGLRPELPENCPPRYQRLFLSCWHEGPQNRPTFEDISAELSSMLEAERSARAKASGAKAYDGSRPNTRTQEKPPRPMTAHPLSRQSASLEDASSPDASPGPDQQRQRSPSAQQDGASVPKSPLIAVGRTRSCHAEDQDDDAAPIGRLRSASDPIKVSQQEQIDNRGRSSADGPARRQSVAERASAAASRILDARPRLSHQGSAPVATPLQLMVAPRRQASAAWNASSRTTSGHNKSMDSLCEAASESATSYSTQPSPRPTQTGPNSGEGDDVISPPPPNAREDNARFRRLVQQSACEGWPLRYSIELRSLERATKDQYGTRHSADFAHDRSRYSFSDSRRSSSVDGSLHSNLSSSAPGRRMSNLQQRQGAPPAAASSGIGVVDSPFAHKRNWQLQENSVASSRRSGSTDASEQVATTVSAPPSRQSSERATMQPPARQ